MTDTFRLTLAQLNPTVGDIPGNADKARAAWSVAKEAGADMVMMTESFLIGYQPQDLVMRPAFWSEAMEVCEALAHLHALYFEGKLTRAQGQDGIVRFTTAA